jgi:hypothetical protein
MAAAASGTLNQTTSQPRLLPEELGTQMATRLRPRPLRQQQAQQQLLVLVLRLPPRHRERSSSQANVHRMRIAHRRAADSRVGSVLLLLLHRKQMAVDLETLSLTTTTPLQAVLELPVETPTRTETPMRMPMPAPPPLLRKLPLPPPPLEASLSPELALQMPTALPHAVDSTLENAQAPLWRRSVMVDVALEMRSQTTMPLRLSRAAAWDGGVLR